MSLAENSIVAFVKGKEVGFNAGQGRVLLALLAHPYGLTDYEIAAVYDIGINCVCNRVGELIEEEFIVKCGDRMHKGRHRRVTKINPKRVVRIAA